MLLAQLISFVGSIKEEFVRGSDEAVEGSMRLIRGRNMPDIVSAIVWVRQEISKVILHYLSELTCLRWKLPHQQQKQY